MNVITNSILKLSTQEKAEIKEKASLVSAPQKVAYSETDFKSEDTRWIVEGINLNTIVTDIVRWDQFGDLISAMQAITDAKFPNKDVQYFIMDSSNPSPITIIYSLNSNSKIEDLLVLLREKMTTDIFSLNQQLQEGKNIIVNFSRETKLWSTLIL